jgi:hypothetical protein
VGVLATAVWLVAVGCVESSRADPAVATLTGCLRQGSGEAVFLLRGATEAGSQGAARDYLLVSVPADVELSASLNHRVSIVGELFSASEGPEPPPGANTVERALRRLAVQSMTDIAASCA